MLHLAFWARLRPLQPPLVLRAYPLGLGQEVTHVFPDGGVQDISADLLIPAQALATEAIGVGARAAVVGVGNLALGRGPAHRLAVGARLGISIQVTSMDDQSVQVASIRPQCLFAPIAAA